MHWRTDNRRTVEVSSKSRAGNFKSQQKEMFFFTSGVLCEREGKANVGSWWHRLRLLHSSSGSALDIIDLFVCERWHSASSISSSVNIGTRHHLVCTTQRRHHLYSASASSQFDSSSPFVCVGITWQSALLSNLLIFALGSPILISGLSLSGIASAFLLGTLTWRAFRPSSFLLVATYFVIAAIVNFQTLEEVARLEQDDFILGRRDFKSELF
ncbi:protein VTE6 [Cucumis melo var. makuwa]|uniref:Protein VTE6 n=1 Tax=Cucumis melo var. makuwa TaxID=1194695 RepID=A0A5D3BDJ9_CUCMM|nr:protein VTE6 [Cucumis melo var. makuwa]